MSEEKNDILDLLDRLHWYYINYRYEHKAEFLCAEYTDADQIDEKYQELREFFINKPFNDAEVFNELEEDERDFLHHLVKLCETKIDGVELEEEHHLVCIKYPFMCEDLEGLYAANDFLLENDIDEFEKLFPEYTIGNLENEIDSIYLILTCIDEFFETLNGDQTTQVDPDPEHCFAE